MVEDVRHQLQQRHHPSQVKAGGAKHQAFQGTQAKGVTPRIWIINSPQEAEAEAEEAPPKPTSTWQLQPAYQEIQVGEAQRQLSSLNRLRGRNLHLLRGSSSARLRSYLMAA